MIDYDMKKKIDRMESNKTAFYKALTFVAAFIIVLLIVWITLLAASKRDAEYELFIYKQHSDSINNANIENHIKDSIRNEFCPEVKVEKDEEGNYTFYYN